MIYKQLGLKIKQRYRKRKREYKEDFTRGSSNFWFLMQQKFPRMFDRHAWKTSKLEK